jgi:serine/threonine protein kinase
MIKAAITVRAAARRGRQGFRQRLEEEVPRRGGGIMNRSELHGYEPGDTIRHGSLTYTVDERWASGPFGAVHAGRDDWGSAVVLHVLRPLSRSYADVREGWHRQALELRRCQHPSLVHIFDSFEHEGRFHLVVERCDHRLDGYLALPSWNGPRWFKAVAAAVLGGLDHMHRAGYNHRNLHPHHVVGATGWEHLHPGALPAGALKLADFGITQLIGNVDLMNTRLAKWLTPPEYLNPSQFGLMDHRVDVYQAGLLLLAVLLRRVPRFTFEEIVAGVPRRTAVELPSSWGRALGRALELKVSDRYPGALDFWQELAGCRRPAAVASV